MFDRLKALGKSLFLPFTFLLGIIYYLFQKDKALEQQLEASKRDAKIQATLAAEQEAKDEANQANADWDKLRGNYINPDGTPKS